MILKLQVNMRSYCKYFLIFLFVKLSFSISVISNPSQVDFKNLRDTKKSFLFKDYFLVLTSQRSLANSIWSKMSYHEGKSLYQYKLEKTKLKTEVHPNFARLINIPDNEFRCQLQKNNAQLFYVMGNHNDIFQELNSEVTNLVCIIQGNAGLKVDGQDVDTNDCTYILPSNVEAKTHGDDHEVIESLVISWKYKEDCKVLGDRNNLYEVLHLEHPHQFLMIHAGDKYLTPNENLNINKFIEKLKDDHDIVTVQLPKWDDECEAAAVDLFRLLDSNEDDIINSLDLELYLNPNKVQRLGKMIANKWNEFNEISFDMKVRIAGPADWSMPLEAVEGLIQQSTSRDYELWLQQQINQTDKVQKDEL